MNIDNHSSTLKQKEENEISEGFEQALKVFKEASQRVPAYKDFLQKNKVDPGKISTQSDFSKFVPPVTKENYLRKYPLPDLMIDGSLFGNNLISVSSGSSGKPFMWFRGEEQRKEAAKIYKDLYINSFNVDKRSTIIIVCFAMGTWVAGTYTTLGSIDASLPGNININVATPGIEKDDAVNVVKEIGHLYEQIIIAGYPPFVKDVIDLGKSEGIDWSNYLVKLSLAGESVSEEWRDSVIGELGGRIKPTETANVYGTADAGIVGFETPMSIAFRRHINSKGMSSKVFDNDILPTFVQFSPSQRFFEQVNGELHFTAASGIPLLRYNIKDVGGVLSVSEVIGRLGLSSSELDSLRALNGTYQLNHFVYIHGRKDFAVSFYALLIYPENIKSALQANTIKDIVSGKFSMHVGHDDNLSQSLEIIVELLPESERNFRNEKLIQEAIIKGLVRNNAEYRKLHKTLRRRSEPSIVLKEFGDKEHFSWTNKQKWVV